MLWNGNNSLDFQLLDDEPHLLDDEPKDKEDENAEEKEVEEVVAMTRLGQLQHLADGLAQET